MSINAVFCVKRWIALPTSPTAMQTVLWENAPQPDERHDPRAQARRRGNLRRHRARHYPQRGQRFCVLRVKTKGHREETTVIGSLTPVSAGEWPLSGDRQT